MESFPVQRLLLLLPPYQSLLEHLPQEVVVGLFLELQGLHVLKVAEQHLGVFSVRFQKEVDLGILLEPSDLRVLLSLVVDLDTLPWEFSNHEVQQQVAQRLQIVSATLLIPLV